ncbi:MAG TPA: hypothetical protein VGS61_02720, partial [Acidimicrobiales bacterium]|nr:hypothetical protein [Acidimicrobiales bacterium]
VATARAGISLRVLDRYEEAVTLCRTAYDELGDDGDVHARGLLAEAVAQNLNFWGRSDEALGWTEPALAAAERSDDWVLLFESLSTRSFALFNVGRHQEAALLARGAAALAEEHQALMQQSRAAMSLSLYALPDDHNEVFRVALECADLARRAGVKLMEETSLLNAVETGLVLGRWRDAEPILDAVAASGVTDRSWSWIGYLGAMLQAVRGDVDAAVSTMRDLDEAQTPTEYIHSQTTMLSSRSYIDYFAGDFAAGLDAANGAVAADPNGINSSVAIAHAARHAIWLRDANAATAALDAASRNRGRFLAALRAEIEAALAAMTGSGDVEQRYADAVDAWRALDSPYGVAITELEAAHLLGPSHPVAAVAKEAEDIFTELEIPVLVERARAVLA